MYRVTYTLIINPTVDLQDPTSRTPLNTEARAIAESYFNQGKLVVEEFPDVADPRKIYTTLIFPDQATKEQYFSELDQLGTFRDESSGTVIDVVEIPL